MINCLIFTKDRAMQLELLLKSIKKNFTELTNITIMYKAETDNYLQGYEKVKVSYPDYNWIKENNLEKDIKNVINNFTEPYSMTFVDDEIIVRDQKIEEGLKVLSNRPDIHALSLRMGKNINYTYTTNIHSSPPFFNTIQSGNVNFNEWNWKKAKPNTDWEYPSCINSHIYRTPFFKSVISKIKFINVNELEANFHANREEFPSNMICFDESKTVSIANNIIQKTHANRNSENPDFSVTSLNNKFLNGYKIDINNFLDIKTNTATFDKPYKFVDITNKNMFKFIVPCFNSEKWINKTIETVYRQNYSNWECIIINDASTDKTFDVIKKSIPREYYSQFKVSNNKVNLGALHNIVNGIKFLAKDPEDIILLLDGDDWLASNDVLSYLNEVYQNPNIWTTYGQFVDSKHHCLGCSTQITSTRIYRDEPWRTSHLRTFKYKIWKLIKNEDLRETNGCYFRMTWDLAIMYPILEMSGIKRIKFIDKILYVYNNQNPINDDKKNHALQFQLASEIKRKPRYEEII